MENLKTVAPEELEQTGPATSRVRVHEARIESEESIQYPAYRDHKYFKSRLVSECRFTKRQASQAYNQLMKDVRDSLMLGYGVHLNPLVDFDLYQRLKGGQLRPSIKTRLHQAVTPPQTIRFGSSPEPEAVSDPDWD